MASEDIYALMNFLGGFKDMTSAFIGTFFGAWVGAIAVTRHAQRKALLPTTESALDIKSLMEELREIREDAASSPSRADSDEESNLLQSASPNGVAQNFKKAVLEASSYRNRAILKETLYSVFGWNIGSEKVSEGSWLINLVRMRKYYSDPNHDDHLKLQIAEDYTALFRLTWSAMDYLGRPDRINIIDRMRMIRNLREASEIISRTNNIYS